jgi:hypothetical protein
MRGTKAHVRVPRSAEPSCARSLALLPTRLTTSPPCSLRLTGSAQTAPLLPQSKDLLVTDNGEIGLRAEREARPTYEQLETCVVQLRDDVDCLIGAIERAGLEGHPMLVDVLERVQL